MASLKLQFNIRINLKKFLKKHFLFKKVSKIPNFSFKVPSKKLVLQQGSPCNNFIKNWNTNYIVRIKIPFTVEVISNDG